MRILIACEFSGRIRNEFSQRGHDAWSCDLLDSETPGNHIKGDVRKVLNDGWDMMIAHPPCTYLAVSGNRWMKERPERRDFQELAIQFVLELMNAPIHRIAIENPISVISGRIRKPDQIIQPWMFGHREKKGVCLWLKNLPKLKPTEIVSNPLPVVHEMGPSKDRWKNRSRTYEGIAKAIAEQWGKEGNLVY